MAPRWWDDLTDGSVKGAKLHCRLQVRRQMTGGAEVKSSLETRVSTAMVQRSLD
jgi:hypothetical protein